MTNEQKQEIAGNAAEPLGSDNYQTEYMKGYDDGYARAFDDMCVLKNEQHSDSLPQPNISPADNIIEILSNNNFSRAELNAIAIKINGLQFGVSATTKQNAWGYDWENYGNGHTGLSKNKIYVSDSKVAKELVESAKNSSSTPDEDKTISELKQKFKDTGARFF